MAADIANAITNLVGIEIPPHEFVALSQGRSTATVHSIFWALLKTLAGETFILFGDPHGDALQRNGAFVAACRAAGFTPRVGQVAPFISSRLNLIAAGLGIARPRWSMPKSKASPYLSSSLRRRSASADRLPRHPTCRPELWGARRSRCRAMLWGGTERASIETDRD
jgi:DNA-binding transcriptional LysR family regulator